MPAESDVTIADIKAYLDDLGVDYPGVTLKDDLYGLLKENWK
ncbi:hypothetical protein Nizo2814_1807 [Lactiplantibacillus plantarum]|nr:hypothetical protein Nizo2814_1807 [Lactiplantibacillus plantarum]